jgi:cytochrome c-type biogenesis protein
MTLELAAVPLALLAGIFGVLSPCVWPLVPVVTASAATTGRTGPLYLASGLAISFAVAGSLLTLVLVSTGMDPELFRYVAAFLLGFVGLALLVQTMSEWLTLRLSSLTSRLGMGRAAETGSARGQFGVGALLGVVWLPCVGPTLGAAIALASMGQRMGTAFVVMLAYGIGTAGVLLLAGLASGRLLSRWRPRMMAAGGAGKKVLGVALLFLALLVLTGADKYLEAMAVEIVPEWVYAL